MTEETTTPEVNPNDGTWVIRDTVTDQVKGFVVGDKTTVGLGPTEEFVAIEQTPTLEKRETFYRYDNGAYTYDASFEQARYALRWRKIRAKEYPPITDYLDGVVKGDQAQIDAYIAACQAVKAKYPKPE